jgi:BirA family biotin operon repressor/biotin-[acetyl-CoA-carboxylase] ligase
VTRQDLVAALADGAHHSGQELARTFGVTRAAVWKHVRELSAWGLVVAARRGKGYRLSTPVSLLDGADLQERIRHLAAFPVERLELFAEIDSTNRHLLDNPPSRSNSMTACLAEYQWAGRGRRGRSWSAPYGAGLCLSTGWQFDESLAQLGGLTLAVGVIVRRVIRELCGAEVELKWPNDLVSGGRKLGGILVEIRSESQGRCHVVVGLGLNVYVSGPQLASLCDWPAGAIDLEGITKGHTPSRQQLAARLIAEIGYVLSSYVDQGFAPYADEWRMADHLRGRDVVVSDRAGSVRGTALGISNDAALLVRTDDGSLRRVIAGDVSVRESQ